MPANPATVGQIELQLDELRNADLSLPTIRKALDFWCEGESTRKEIRAAAKDDGECQDLRRKLRELDYLCASILCHFCEQAGINTRSVKYGSGYKGNKLMPDGRKQWQHDADLIRMAIRSAEGKQNTDSPATQPPMQASSYTLGHLINELEGSEKTREWIDEEYEREEAKHGKLGADGWRFRAEVFGLFHPNPTMMPGIDRIEHLCDAEFHGSGLTAANVRQLKVRICKKLKWNSEQAKCADGLSLVEAADILEGIQVVPWQTFIAAANTAARLQQADLATTRKQDSELVQLPESVFLLLELIADKPYVPWPDIPADLHDAWRIARNRDLITTNTADPLIDAERHECYRGRFSYWLTESGKDELALSRARQAERATSAKQEEPALPAASAAVSPDELTSMIAAIGDENTAAIFSIAQDESKGVDYKLRAIAAIDRRFLGRTSTQWGKLLRVTDAAIRGTEWWKVDKKRVIEEEKQKDGDP